MVNLREILILANQKLSLISNKISLKFNIHFVVIESDQTKKNLSNLFLIFYQTNNLLKKLLLMYIKCLKQINNEFLTINLLKFVYWFCIYLLF